MPCFRLLLPLLLCLPAATAAAQAEVLPLQIQLATLEWPPYVGAELPGQGYAAEVVRAACARGGIEVRFEFMPWARALMLAQQGSYAGVLPEYSNPLRERQFVFSAPFPGGPVGLYKRHGDAIAYARSPAEDLDAALRSLARYRIGTVRDFVNNEVFDRADYLKREESASDTINLRKLQHGRIDLVFIDRWVAEYVLRTDALLKDAALEMLQPPIAEPALHVAWSRTADVVAQARPACDRGLGAIQADGTLSRLREKHGVAMP
ncbi:amino acid ABC transporter substrate-binding protein (PAAT family) [Tahibacter aquaticus]|uniref:Amino acid ABC transporter substrate-binding protein (PAAT family) n=1 Tax=Tahibacter aquaticus TaxID=520092 RepID=A0A4R6YTI8_9GAMM|nr:transporter substrate-binding domain-containing protein [Tahibacter aquaticus]TDR41604.1 amino acid ABC transporter substrate-binding protein (PAAT family) [Tahibacter aquaticus]